MRIYLMIIIRRILAGFFAGFLLIVNLASLAYAADRVRQPADSSDKKIVYKFNIERNIDEPALKHAAENLYGMTLVDFNEMILIPQARREILEGRLYLEKQNLDDWLAQALGSARVTILTPEFIWDNNKVALRD